MLDSVSLAGSRLKPNEDASGATALRAWVIDGATGLGDPIIPGTSDAAWIARRASYLFYRFAHISDTTEMLTQVAAELEKAFVRERGRAPQERWEIPCAAFMMLTLRRDNGVEVSHLGDCRLLLRTHDGIAHAIGATAESERQERSLPRSFRPPARRRATARHRRWRRCAPAVPAPTLAPNLAACSRQTRLSCRWSRSRDSRLRARRTRC